MADNAWKKIPIDAPLFKNLNEVTVRKSATALENCFLNEAGGHTRFPGFRDFANLGGGDVYVSEWRNDLIAVTGLGRVFRVDKSAALNDATGVVASGGSRPTFAKSEDQLAIAAGGTIVQLSGEKTELLSPAAPQSSAIVYIDGRFVAGVKDSQIFQHTPPREFTTWDPLDLFQASGRADDITCMVVNEFREMIVGGPESVEQFEPYPGGDTAFARRWQMGEGIFAPATLVAADNGAWGVNRYREFTRFSGQSSKPQSRAIGLVLEAIREEHWNDAWATLLNAFGQKFIILQIPEAPNGYGTTGLTFLFDYANKRWSLLYGFTQSANRPERWPGWSYCSIWGRHFFGTRDGRILELDRTAYTHAGTVQRMLFRSGIWRSEWENASIEGVRIILQRGEGGNDGEGQIMLRSRRDNRDWTLWQTKGLGRAGETDLVVYFGAQGIGNTFQFEYQVTDDVEVNVMGLEVKPEAA